MCQKTAQIIKHEVDEMKTMKTRIAAAACAAITAICGAQALTASAFNYNHPYSLNTQEWCTRNLGRSLRMWQSYGLAEGTYWSNSVKAGTMVGKGFTNAHISSYSTNQNIFNQMAFPRYLACSHFGFDAEKAAWMEIPQADCNGCYEGGDQIFLKSNGTYHAVFVESYYNTLYCSELDSSKHIRWNVTYERVGNTQLKRVRDGKIFDILYVARPIKEGDANGDGRVEVDDCGWIGSHYGNGIISGTNRDILMAAADVSGNWQIDWDDLYGIYTNMTGGIMGRDGRYVMAKW